ncbi:MAG: hypothetical protein ABFC88_13020 [Thermoguttaceae bacterium]
MEGNIFDIPAFNYSTLAEQVAKLNKRAVKLGCEPMRLTVVREFEIERESPSGVKHMHKRMEIKLEGETPKFNGWSLLAAIEMQPNGENLVRCVPGKTVPEQYRMTDTHCDHCKSDRRRKEVFILGHEDGRFAQVGRQCIVDFLGRISAGCLAARATWELSLLKTCENARDEDYCGGFGEFHRDITEFLAVVAIVVRRLGWVSRQMAMDASRDGQSTSQIARYLITGKRDEPMAKFVRDNQLYVEDRDQKLAQEVLEWARNQPKDGVADYIYNLGVSCRQDSVTYKTIGIVASAIAAYQRHLDKEAELNIRRSKKLESKHVGAIKERKDFENVEITRMRYCDSPFGVKTLVTFQDPDGNVLIWWASKELDDVEEGDRATIRGTISKHGEYNGVAQTELKRVTITKIEPPAASAA